MKWCEHCRDHFPDDHYEEYDVDAPPGTTGGHKAGSQYGPAGRARAAVKHEDALQASRTVMKRALSEIAFYSGDEEAAKKALAALEAEHQTYVLGVNQERGRVSARTAEEENGYASK